MPIQLVNGTAHAGRPRLLLHGEATVGAPGALVQRVENIATLSKRTRESGTLVESARLQVGS